MRGSLAVFAAGVIGALLAIAQTSAEFEVVSIRPYISQGNSANENSFTDVHPGGRLTAGNVSIRKLVRNSFLLEDSRVIGLPGWVDSETFNIDAKTAGGIEITRDNISQLMKSVLESRFHFRYHLESRETPEYALEVARGGAKLAPHTDSPVGMSTNSNSGVVTLKAAGISMHDLAGTLARQTGRPVVDRTALAGTFDLTLTWSSDQAADTGLPSIFTAVQEAGLRLTTTKGPADYIVVDHVERPSEN
jgi:uncharacterized protein (TIGR03435 family)